MELELSTSPRATWVWASDEEQASTVRALLAAGGRAASDARGGNAEPRTIDVDFGIEALEAIALLREAGYTFRWHMGQHALNRAPDLYGIPVQDAKSTSTS